MKTADIVYPERLGEREKMVDICQRNQYVINKRQDNVPNEKRLKTALCNGLKNWDKEQAENKPIFSTPNRLAKGRVQVFYILQAEEIGAYGR